MNVAKVINDRILYIAGAALLLLSTLLAILAATANAATLTDTYLRLDRLSDAQTTSFRVVFQAVSNQTANLTIDFDGTDSTAWTDGGPGGVVNATQTVSSTTCDDETGFTSLPGTLSASGSGSTVTVSGVGATSSGTTYCVDLTSASAVTTPTAGEYHPVITIGSDSTTVAVRIISNDQVVVNATVPPTFNFTLSANTTSFTTNLTAGSVVSTTGVTASIATNATNGWIVWVKDNTGTSLDSATAGNDIDTVGTLDGSPTDLSSSPNTEQYALDIDLTTDSGNGTPSIAGEYNGGANSGGTFSNVFQMGASSTGTATNDQITFVGKATISPETPAANDYTDTWTIIGAGQY